MAEPTDVAELAEASPTKAALLDRFPMRDETGDIRSEFVGEMSRAIEAEDTGVLRAVVAELHEADLGDLIGALAPDDRVRLVELTGTDFDFSALNEVDETVREEILEELEPETVAEGVRELESDDAVEILESLDEKEQEEILDKLPRSERDVLERSLDYPENSAGRRMQTEFIAVPLGWTVGQAIDYMRETPNLPDRFYEIYAVDRDKHWQGAVSLDALLRSRRPVPLSELIDEDRRRRARGHSGSDGAGSVACGPGGGVGHVRHDDYRRGRILFLSWHRDALVRLEIGPLVPGIIAE